jgi:hypothetical protein
MNFAIGSRTEDYITSWLLSIYSCLVMLVKGLGLGGEIPEMIDPTRGTPGKLA